MSGCAGSCCSSGPSCPCSPDQNPEINSLPHLVACFQTLQAGLHAEQAYYASLPSLRDAVINAVQALDEESSLRPGGDSGITQEQRDEVQQRLVASLDKIRSCTSFIDLHTYVVAAFGTETDHETNAYDTALRISLHTELLPEQILVHKSNRRSISALCSPLPEIRWLSRSELPLPFQQLSAAEAELCLSTCWQKICDWLEKNDNAASAK